MFWVKNSKQVSMFESNNWSVITDLGSQVHAIICDGLRQTTSAWVIKFMRPVYRGCLYSNYTQWFLELSPDFRLDRVRISQE